MLRMSCGGLVTPDHLLLVGGEWQPASNVFAQRVQHVGKVYHLTVETDEPIGLCRSPLTERSYALASGLFAHNLKR